MRLIRYRFGEFVLDPAVRELSRAGHRLPLPLKSLECLVYLVANRERAVGRDELVSAVWGRADVSDTVITQTMRRARKALDDAGDRQTMIRTVPGFGYRWVAEVEELDPAAPAVTSTYAPEAIADVESADAPAPVAVAIEPEAGSVSRRRRISRWLIVLALVTAVLLLGFVVARIMRPAPSSTASTAAAQMRATVLPVRVAEDEADASWVRLGAMEYAADRLRGAALQVTPTEQTLHLGAGLEESGALDTDTLKQLLARSDARWLIVPSAQRSGTQWRVQLRVLDSGSDVSVEAVGDTPLQAMAVATDAWLHRIQRASPDRAAPTALQERLRRIDAELDAGQLDAARAQIQATPASLRDSAALQVREGQLEYRAGRMADAARLFERALAQQPAAPAGVRAKGLMGLGGVALRMGHPDQAQAHYSQALAVLADDASNRDTSLLGNAYNGRGVAQVQQGNLEAAVADLGQARIAMRRTGDVVSAAMVGANLGRMEGMRNHWPQALQEFDSAIDVFERFQVNDYLAATLAAKALAQLELVQPAQARATLARTDALRGALEDPQLIAVIQNARATVALATGKLGDAEAAIDALAATTAQDPSVTRLRMALAMARGDVAGAGRWAGDAGARPDGQDAGAAAIAVQAAATSTDAARWLRPEGAGGAAARPDPADAFARAIVQHRFGDRAAALRDAQAALAIANRDGSPNDRVRANLLRARILMDAGQMDQATAILGELEAYAAVDYRVAWLAAALYGKRGDAGSARQARQEAKALAGERIPGVVPLL
ncbi:winged helix-turn-helix domain-containing protein [Stenotrophomonas sp. GbtcB23]|uniref:winged helix-turn-helix domain-containing protein n=1 Tax=Stenotrophomonas sp. GbtcB23 TaxID=2824768 RepID=UPI001C2FF0D2|nr:winged helix-turn-helix domain-containing protein [Stenotrophomonas sp. GbtcB23]